MCLMTVAAAAQDSLRHSRLDSVQHVGEVEVYGRRPMATEQTLRGAELQALSATSVADALKYFAGVQIKDYGGLGGLKTINVRSLGAQHVGVFIDGIRLSNAQNGTVDLGKFSLSSMESVSLYNANKLDNCQSASEYASGATVYLRTRRPTSDSLSVQLRRASFATYMAKANVQFSIRNSKYSILNGWSGFVDGEYCRSEGDYPFRYHSQYEDTVGHRQGSDIRYERIEAALFKGGFSSHIYYYDSERGCPGGIVRRLSDKYVNIGREWDHDFFVQAAYSQEFASHHRLKVNARYANEYLRYCTDYPENQNTARVDNHYRQEDLYGALCYGYMPWPWLSLSASYDVRWSKLQADLKRFDNVFRLDQKQVVAAQANYHGLQAAASLLHQHLSDETFANVGAAEPLDRWTPAVSVQYSPLTSHASTLTMRLWYKKIFRAPTLNDLYYTQVGNRNLQPEYTKQWNAGLEYHGQWPARPKDANKARMVNGQRSMVNGQWSIDLQADVYQNRIENRIVCLPMKGTYTWTMMNYGETFCRGLNATASLRYTCCHWNASLLGSLTWQRDVNRTNPDDTDTYDLPICYSPTLSHALTAILGWRGLSLTVSHLHVGERMWSYADPEDMLEPYNNIDVKLNCDLTSLTSHLSPLISASLCLEVCDLLDEQYEHIPRYPMPGRNYKLTLSVGI